MAAIKEGMNQLPIVTVRGEAQLEVPPETAEVHAMVLVRGRTRETVEGRLVELSNAIAQVIEPIRGALRRHSADASWVNPVLRSRRNNSAAAHFYGRRSWTIEVADFRVLPKLMADLVVGEEVTVGGPYWSLEADSPVYQQARLAAVRDAVARATAYAEAFGAKIESLIEFSDSGLMGGAREMAMFSRGMPAAAGGGATRSAMEDLEIDPVVQTVSGGIEARFTMSQPDLGALLHSVAPSQQG